jgi:site-specific recombinase XerD
MHRRRRGRPGPTACSFWDSAVGPLTERGIRTIVAKLGQAAKLDEPLSPHDLRHTFAKALLDPGAYGLTRPAVPLTTVQELLGHAALATTALYTRPSYADLARLMGDRSTHADHTGPGRPTMARLEVTAYPV